MVTKDIEKRPALARAGVYVIHDAKTGKYSGKILFAHPQSAGDGILYAALWDFTPAHGREVQNGRATGGGYNKESAALDSMRFGTGDQMFFLDCNGTGMDDVRAQFEAHGYILQWVV